MSDVLLIEPDAVLAKTYRQALSSSGYKVNSFDSVQAAIHAMDKTPPKLIIMELQLGKHNGVEFLYEMRSYPDWDSIPVIVLSRINEVESGLNAKTQKQLGIKTYYYKPSAKLQDIISSVGQIIS